jgi:hypothetical protein
MINSVVCFILVLFISGCSAPKPPQVSLTGNLSPVNFNEAANSPNIVIRSEQGQKKEWRKQFAYSIESPTQSPEFFYAVAHADQIIARIKPPFSESVFAKVRESLRGYGIITPIELVVTEEDHQQPQVILDCLKFKQE